MRDTRQLPKPTVLAIMRRVGMADLVDQASAILPDPVDLDRDAELLATFGLTRGHLIDMMGGSP